MGLLHQLRRRWFGLAFTLALGLGIFGLSDAPARAVPTTATTGSAESTTTTVFKLSQGVQSQVDALTAQAQAVQAELDALDLQLDQKTEEFSACVAELDAAYARMSSLRRMVARAQADKAQAQAQLAARIKSVYMAGGRDQLLQLLFLSDDLQDLYNRVRLVSTLADQDKRLVSNLKNSSTRLDLLVKAMDDQKARELALRKQLAERSAEIEVAMAQKEQKLAGLDARVKAIVEQERQRQMAERERLEKELQAKLLAAQAAAQNRIVMGQASPRGANVLTPEQIAFVARKAGFRGENLVIAVAVALAESSGNANAEGDVAIGGSFGLWQIFCMAHPDLIPPGNPDSVAWYDPYQNALWAYEVSGGDHWGPWSTYIHGTYLSHMAEARAAVDTLNPNP
jgi:peptidoglycan hydrolase CwlO-like protein